MSEPILSISKLNKSFGAVHVLHDVDFDVYPGKVTALIGDNGAGKSTLVKCLAGIYGRKRADHVSRARPSPSPTRARRRHSRHQACTRTLRCVDNLDIVQNMFLGRETPATGSASTRGRWNRLARQTLASPLRCAPSRRSVNWLPALGWPAPDRRHRQGGAVGEQVVVLDEPTAALGVAQTRQVLDLVRRLAERGRGVVSPTT